MAMNQWILNQETPGQLRLQDMPQHRFKAHLEPSHQLAAYFRSLLSDKTQGAQGEVILPSIMHLSGYFNRSELDILDALHELSKQGYSYCLSGLESPIKLRTPAPAHGHEVLGSSNRDRSRPHRSYLTPPRA